MRATQARPKKRHGKLTPMMPGLALTALYALLGLVMAVALLSLPLSVHLMPTAPYSPPQSKMHVIECSAVRTC
jgi:hypothetical protein